MKNLLTTIFSLFFLIGVAQNETKSKLQDYKSNPPGTAILNDSLYMDLVPVTNRMYREFIDSMELFWSEKVHDSISKLPNYGLSFPKSNYDPEDNKDKTILVFDAGVETHPAYSKYPRINITKSEAELFCRWRTDMVKIYFGTLSKTADEAKDYPLNFIYRLPTTKEFNTAIEKIGYSNKSKKKHKDIPYRLNISNNKKNIVFLKNNLSEYTEDATPFGDNWKNESKFSESNDYTGFRCVCEILE